MQREKIRGRNKEKKTGKERNSIRRFMEKEGDTDAVKEDKMRHRKIGCIVRL